jgi:hypothetical protein
MRPGPTGEVGHERDIFGRHALRDHLADEVCEALRDAARRGAAEAEHELRGDVDVTIAQERQAEEAPLGGMERELVEEGLEVIASEVGLVLVRRESVPAHRRREGGEDAAVVDVVRYAGFVLRLDLGLTVLVREADRVVDGDHHRGVAGDERRARRARVCDAPARLLVVGLADGALRQEDARHVWQEAADQKHTVGLHARDVGPVRPQVAGERKEPGVEHNQHLVVRRHADAVGDAVRQLLIRVVRA